MATSLIIDAKNEKKYKDLVGRSKKGRAFSTQKSAHLVAAVIALKLNLNPKIVKNKRDIIKYTSLSEKEQKTMRYIALASTKDPYILNNEDKIVDIINGLASAGFDTLYDTLFESGGDHVYRIIEYCQKYFWKDKRSVL